MKHLYATLPETEIEAVAQAAELRLGDADLGLAAEDLGTDLGIVRALGGRLRALENLYASLDQGEAAADPNEDWRIALDGHEAFFVPLPRTAWRLDPPDGPEPPKTPAGAKADLRPFDQRGLLKVRILPTTVDGAQVRFCVPETTGRAPALGRFGAALFADLTFEEASGPGVFRITGVDGPDLAARIHEACWAAHTEDYRAAIFPELTIDPERRDYIGELLGEKPWNDDPEQATVGAPSIVVAGSWHDPVEDGYANVATVFDGHGDVLLRYHKRFAYKDDKGRFEDIIPGEAFPILVLADGLHAFGICLDFCHRCFDTPYGELDVDFVLVPSCGDDKTMASHLETAADLHRRRRARTFVVQQAWPKLPEGLGFVLPPDGAPMAKSPAELIKRDFWSVFPT